MPRSVLDAIRLGLWDYEPDNVRTDHYSRTDALPGTHDKLSVLTERVRLGLPLWHPSDRANCEGLFGPNEDDR